MWYYYCALKISVCGRVWIESVQFNGSVELDMALILTLILFIKLVRAYEFGISNFLFIYFL